MTKFHINGKGNAGVCKADRGKCAFGLEEDHYASKEAARAAYEERHKNPPTFEYHGVVFNANRWSNEEPTVYATRKSDPFLIGHGRMYTLSQGRQGDYRFLVSHKTSSGWYSANRDYAKNGFSTAQEALQAAEKEALTNSRAKLTSLKGNYDKTFTDDAIFAAYEHEKTKYHTHWRNLFDS